MAVNVAKFVPYVHPRYQILVSSDSILQFCLFFFFVVVFLHDCLMRLNAIVLFTVFLTGNFNS